MDENPDSSSAPGYGHPVRIAAWILLALALGVLFCWRVATTDPRWREAPSSADVQGK